jgi:hypothetical protein
VIYKVKLKNSEESVSLDSTAYEWLTTDPYFAQIDMLNNLRLHSSGCAVFQKTWRRADGSFKTETHYLHKAIAEKFLLAQKDQNKNLVGAKNGNKLDCRIENLAYRTRSMSSRQRKTTSSTGYTGVYREHQRYRAVISINGKAQHIGMFDTAEEAAAAYNKLSKEFFADDGKINKVKGWGG